MAKATKKTATSKESAPKKKAATKKAAPKKDTAEKKAAPKKKAAPTEKKTATKDKKEKTGLPKPQLKILQTLADNPKPMTKKQVIEQGNLETTSFGGYAGLIDPEKRAVRQEKSGRKSLLTLGYVKLEQHDVDGKDVLFWQITPEGKNIVEQAK